MCTYQQVGAWQHERNRGWSVVWREGRREGRREGEDSVGCISQWRQGSAWVEGSRVKLTAGSATRPTLLYTLSREELTGQTLSRPRPKPAARQEDLLAGTPDCSAGSWNQTMNQLRPVWFRYQAMHRCMHVAQSDLCSVETWPSSCSMIRPMAGCVKNARS